MAGEGVLEFVREEDFVEYFLFPKGISEEKDKGKIWNALDVNFSLISCTVSEYKHGYIWHKDPFNVAPKFGDESSSEDDYEKLPPHLHGITHYGDNIEDEWFLVFLLLQLTRDIDGLVVRVVDSDGEFLLIEAAEHLPAWADPETCQQRVYLSDGAIHLIPVPPGTGKAGSIIKIPSVSDAVDLVRTSPDVTRAPQAIQDAVFERIKGYPEKIKENLHRATVCVPVGVAALLKQNPSLISPAVRAFCYRDPVDMRACRAMRYFPPENCVMASVVFTRCLYAMITHHKFMPDRRTGWTIPPTTSPDFKAYHLGVKVACGFEILVSQAKPSCNTPSSEGDKEGISEKNSFEDDRGWTMYLNSLKKKGYFKELLEGSKDYKELMGKAQEFYVKNCSSTPKGCPDQTSGEEVFSLLNKLDYDLEEMKKASQNLPEPDDESWLEINPEDLEKILEQRYGRPEVAAARGSGSVNPAEMTTTLNSFLEHVSGLEGAEFPKAETSSTADAPVRPKRGQKKGKKVVNFSGDMNKSVTDEMTSSTIDNRLSFDPEGFSCAVQNILDFVIPEDSWDMDSGSDDSEMGSYEDEAEMDLDQMNADKMQSPQTEIKQYMDQMDRELADTTMGQSFEKKAQAKPRKEKRKGAPSSSREDDSFDDIENFEPVDIDMNALKNILESYQSQLGGAGPAPNLLGPMGIHLENMSAKPSDD